MPEPTTPSGRPPASDTRDRSTSRQHAQDLEWKHFKFAMWLLFGTMLSLPILGALVVLFFRWGWLPASWIGR